MKELKDVLKFVFSFGVALDKSLADHKISLDDASHFFSIVKYAGPAFENISAIPAEFKAMTKEEQEELMAFIKTEFDIADDKLEAIIEEGIKLALDIYRFVLLFKKQA